MEVELLELLKEGRGDSESERDEERRLYVYIGLESWINVIKAK